VIGVHLFGQHAPMDRLVEVTAGRDIALVEDAAQAQGATRSGRPIGSWGVAAATSFYPGKNLGAYGDAGAVLTDDDALAATVRMIGSHGGARRYEHDVIGCNSRLDTLQAAVLRAKLTRLDGWNEARRRAAARYDELLADVAAAGRVVLPATLAGNEHVWHLYVVKVANRDATLARLQAAGIGAGIHYPVPVHLTKAFSHLGRSAGAFPIAEQLADQMISLPLYPHISPDQQSRVADALREAMA
jgi:dTDP-4-amino-4,6-dideoxygalactose transaminase